MEEAPVLRLQDPFYAVIRGELVVGGVSVLKTPSGALTGWETHFYKGSDLFHLSMCAKGPMNMKDIRLVEMRDGCIGIFTRPHGLPDARAKIGFVAVNAWEQVNDATIANAPLINDLFLPQEWGGANEIHLLEDGMLGVVGHVAYQTENDVLHYHPMTFLYDPSNGWHSPVKMLACRDFFPKGESKEPRLGDVVFAGGLVRDGNGGAILYVGISDAEAACAAIPDPFQAYSRQT